MHIVLLILKIIGIVLGSILGLLLALLFMVLFVPVRYRICAEQKEKLQFQIRVSWFLRCIDCFGRYEEKQFLYHLKILGITVKDNFSKKKKHRKVKKKSKKAKKKSEIITKQTKKNRKKQKENMEIVSCEIGADEAGLHENTKQITTEAEMREENHTIINMVMDGKNKTEEEFTFFEKVSAVLSKKYYHFLKKINSIQKKIKNMLISMENGISKLKLIWSFLTEEENKVGFKACLETVKKVIKHIKPKVLKGYLKFGTADPCTTGQILGIIAIFYGKFGRFFKITPDFEEAVLEYSIDAKGRIRIFTIGKIVLKLWFSKELKKVIENFEHCKEELKNGR